MNKITKKMNVDFWVTSDGEEFTRESDAKYHEKKIANYDIGRNIKTMKMTFSLFNDVLSDEWFFVSNQMELDYLTEEHVSRQYPHIRSLKSGKIILGDWVAVEYSGYDSDGSKEKYGLVTLNYVLNEMKKFVENMENITVDGQY